MMVDMADPKFPLPTMQTRSVGGAAACEINRFQEVWATAECRTCLMKALRKAVWVASIGRTEFILKSCYAINSFSLFDWIVFVSNALSVSWILDGSCDVQEFSKMMRTKVSKTRHARSPDQIQSRAQRSQTATRAVPCVVCDGRQKKGNSVTRR
jgi:hypothetical protein